MSKVTIKTGAGRRARHPDGSLITGEQSVTWGVHYERLKKTGDIEVVESDKAPAKKAADTRSTKEA